MSIDNDNYVDYAEAIHCYATLNHEGQGSTMYSILSMSKFKPGPLWTEDRCIEENYIYGEITDDNIEALVNELNDFMGSREDND